LVASPPVRTYSRDVPRTSAAQSNLSCPPVEYCPRLTATVVDGTVIPSEAYVVASASTATVFKLRVRSEVKGMVSI